jgi:hypothetical protein
MSRARLFFLLAGVFAGLIVVGIVVGNLGDVLFNGRTL